MLSDSFRAALPVRSSNGQGVRATFREGSVPDIEAAVVDVQLVLLVGLHQHVLVLLMPLKQPSLRQKGKQLYSQKANSGTSKCKVVEPDTSNIVLTESVMFFWSL